jgi:hypothetical protein
MEGFMNQGNRERDRGTFEQLGEQIGGAAGRAMGRGSDMAAGMIGSMLGTAMNQLGDWWTTADAQRAASSFDEGRDRSCRQHFEAEATVNTESQRAYDDVRPLYQFGHVAGQNPEFRGRDFNEVEPDLQRAWGEESRQQHGDWPEVRGYVGFGYSQENPESPRDF